MIIAQNESGLRGNVILPEVARVKTQTGGRRNVESVIPAERLAYAEIRGKHGVRRKIPGRIRGARREFILLVLQVAHVKIKAHDDFAALPEIKGFTSADAVQDIALAGGGRVVRLSVQVEGRVVVVAFKVSLGHVVIVVQRQGQKVRIRIIALGA